MDNFSVEIVQSGRGGTIIYREQDKSIDFGWEFAMPPSIALVFGPSVRAWDTNYPWASGRCAAIYNAVGADIVRQQAPGGSYSIDFDNGMIDIIRR
jgi:hypothetical protein